MTKKGVILKMLAKRCAMYQVRMKDKGISLWLISFASIVNSNYCPGAIKTKVPSWKSSVFFPYRKSPHFTSFEKIV
jgi:hypothetical protein